MLEILEMLEMLDIPEEKQGNIIHRSVLVLSDSSRNIIITIPSSNNPSFYIR